MLKRYDPHLHVREIVLVGVGGTGSAIARYLARLLVHMQALNMSVPTLTLIDPDVIEPRNIGRQQFVPAMVGMPKSQAVALMLSSALGLPIRYITEKFNARQHIGCSSYGVLLIDAVDNHLARREINTLSGVNLISCGNGRDFSQVCLGSESRDSMLDYLTQVEIRQQTLGEKDTLRYLPHPYVLFPQLLEPDEEELVEAESCSTLVAQQEQGLYVNNITALVAARYVQQILLRELIESFISFINMQGALTTRAIPVTIPNIRSYLEG